MKEALKYWWLVLIKGIILILLSFFVFGNPVSALMGLVLYIGIATLATGIFLIIVSLSGPKEENWGWRLAEGIIDLIFGFVLLSNPGISAAVLPFVVGFWVIFSGILTFVGSFTAKKEGDSSWWMNLISGILIIIIGYIITNNFFVGAVAITFWIGLGFLIAGVISISASLRMRKLMKAA
jgi:uncharacterized membrane protein HdeD (DUF308 family)